MINKRVFGVLDDGRQVMLYRITNRFGEYVELLDYGACVYSVFVRDKNGALGDVVLGPKDLTALTGRSMSGVTVGRCANRIAYGRFTLNGKTVQLECNPSGHYIHGASGAYGKKLFHGALTEHDNEVCFTYEDLGEGGFGNRVSVEVRMAFLDSHQLVITYRMTPEETTLLCPTNHAYFNLDGVSDIRAQKLRIYADRYAVKGDLGMPQGETADVAGTPLDFRRLSPIGDALHTEYAPFFRRDVPEMDDIFLLDRCRDRTFGLAAILYSERTGRRMSVYTDMPAMVVFTRCVCSPMEGKRNERYEGYCSIALETQYVPNAVNCTSFDIPAFDAGQTLTTKTVYEFDVQSALPQTEQGLL